MQAIILATSETNKLRPLTDTIPSAMLPVVNRPVMLYAIEQLAQQDFKNVIVNLYHLPGSVEAYFGLGQRWNISITYVLQREPWGSAGALKWSENLLKETFLILPADQIFDLDIQTLLAWHRARKSIATVVVHPVKYGKALGLTENGELSLPTSSGIHAKAPMYSTGIYLFEPQVLKYIPARTEFDIPSQLIPALLDAGIPVRGYPLPEMWHPINAFQDLQNSHWTYLDRLKAQISRGTPQFLSEIPLRARMFSDGIWVGRNTVIHPTVNLFPPVFIGENCLVGKDVELGPHAMIGSNVLIDDGATIAHSTVLENTYIGQLVNIQNSIASPGLLIDLQTSESTRIVDQFLLGEARTFDSDSIIQRLPDILLTLILLFLLFPLFLGLALLALFASGRVFTQNEHVGTSSTKFNEDPPSLKKFKLLRFGTRKPDHVTSLGKWLEKWELNRLPELWNVLTGDLRLIGVKPLIPDEAVKIVENWQQKRNEYSVGFTGYWYIQTSPASSLDEILIADAYYVATRSWREDLRLLWQTPAAWWKRATT